MLRRTCLLAVFGVVAGASCAAPQHNTTARAFYLPMATSSGALAGVTASAFTCLFLRHGLSHPRGKDTTDNLCVVGGAVIGGGTALYGSLEAEREPDAAQWVVVSLGTATFAAAVISWLMD